MTPFVWLITISSSLLGCGVSRVRIVGCSRGEKKIGSPMGLFILSKLRYHLDYRVYQSTSEWLHAFRFG